MTMTDVVLSLLPPVSSSLSLYHPTVKSVYNKHHMFAATSQCVAPYSGRHNALNSLLALSSAGGQTFPRRRIFSVRAEGDTEDTADSTTSSSAAPGNGSSTTIVASGADSGELEVPKKKKTIRRVKTPENLASKRTVEGAGPAVNDNLEVRMVEDKRVTVEGVAKIDKNGGLSEQSAILRTALLVGGDSLAILLFAWIGRATHVSAAVDIELLKTATPFLAGWFISAAVQGGYKAEVSSSTGAKDAALAAAKIWALGIPLGIAFRSVMKWQAPQVPFVIVSLVSTAALLVGWRAVLFPAIGRSGQGSGGGDRRGNPLEFFELLSSLIRRW